MKNLKIFSMNLGRRFIPVKDKRKKEYLRDFIKEEDYDIIMLQGNDINVSYRNLGYEEINSNNKVITFLRSSFLVCDIDFSNFGIVNSFVTYYDRSPLSIINVNCKNPKDMDKVFKACDVYSKEDDPHYVKSRIVAGRFPREVDTNLFCDAFDLEDVSTLIGQKTHAKNNREMLNHFFISRNLECMNIHKLVGMTEESKIGEAYPIEVTLKKVLK